MFSAREIAKTKYNNLYNDEQEDFVKCVGLIIFWH